MFVCAFFIEVMWDMRDRRGDLLGGIRTIGNAFPFRQVRLLLIGLSLISGAIISAVTFSGILPASSYFLLLNNVAVVIIASLYKEEREQFSRKLSDLTILLAIVLFLSFGLVAYFSK